MKRPLLVLLGIGLLCCFPACGAKKTAAPLPPPWEIPAQRAIRQGNASYLKGCHSLALQQYQAALEGYTAADNTSGTALSLNNMGNAYRMIRRYEDALACYKEAAHRAGLLGEKALQDQARINEIALFLETGHVQEAAERMADMDPPDTLPALIRPKARLLFLEGRSEEAKKLLEEALLRTDDSSRAGLLFSLGEILLDTKEPEAARPLLLEALHLDRQSGKFAATAADLMALARCEALLENHGPAADYARRAMEIWALTGDASRLAEHEKFFLELAETSRMDMTLPRHFIPVWTEGRAVAGPCD